MFYKKKTNRLNKQVLYIVDNFDLKELEKWGFKFSDYSGKYEFITEGGYIKVNSWDRKIVVMSEYPVIEHIPVKLFDLIEEGLIEKIENTIKD